LLAQNPLRRSTTLVVSPLLSFMRPHAFFPFFFLLPRSTESLHCRTALGLPTDWFFVLKTGGCSDASLRKCSWHFSFDPSTAISAPGALNASTSLLDPNALGATLSALGASRLSAANATAVVHWNDDPPLRFCPARGCPTRAWSTNGHAKGVLAADADGGFWLTHSWPEFPDTGAPGASAWSLTGVNPNASTIYGQSFLCVSLPLAGVDAVARALLAMEPLTYDSVVPAAMGSVLPALAALARGERNVSAPLPTVLRVASSGGSNFTHVSKNGAWGGELYSDAVVPALGRGTALWVETWRRNTVNGTDTFPSICMGVNGSAVNVRSLSVSEGAAPLESPQQFTVDHSKWAVAVCGALGARGNGTGSARGAVCAGAPGFRPWVCVGDINMAASQASRGGGTVCFDHSPSLWGRLAEGVAATDGCSPTPTENGAPAPTVSGTPSPTPAPTVSGTPSPAPAPTVSGTPSPPTPANTSASLGPPPPQLGAAEEAMGTSAVAGAAAGAGLLLVAAGVGLVFFFSGRDARAPPAGGAHLFTLRKTVLAAPRDSSPSWRNRSKRGGHWNVRGLVSGGSPPPVVSLNPAAVPPRSPVAAAPKPNTALF
jgi:deoxyribonuclease-2